jgi:predicted ATP-grasp superfamily ATP-dependent carboligase
VVNERSEAPPVCVLGEIDLVRALGLAGIRSAVAATVYEPAHYSRHTATVLERIDPWLEPEAAANSLLAFARTQPQAPALFYDADWDLLVVSRFRDRLREGLRFVVPHPELVEDLVDKSRFQALARRRELPVPRAVRVGCEDDPRDELGLRFPVVVKPLTRQMTTWAPVTRSKVADAGDPSVLRRLRERLAASGLDAIVQEAVPGPETAIESYHVYVDADGEIAAEFTGRKLRTWPRRYGYSTALEITRSASVRELGRDLVERLDLQGVAKFDLKRAPNGELKLLEVNPRFNLWHHPGALAGVNIPALVHADLMGLPRPPAGEAKPGVRWCSLAHDLPAARAEGTGVLRWARWALACEAKSGFAWDDPLPLPRALGARLRRRLGRGPVRRGAAGSGAEPAHGDQAASS